MNMKFLLATAALLSALSLPSYAESTWNVNRVGPGVAPQDQGDGIYATKEIDLFKKKPKNNDPNTGTQGLQPIDEPQPFVPQVNKTISKNDVPPQSAAPGAAPNGPGSKNLQPDTPVQPGTLQITSVNGVPNKPSTPGTASGLTSISQLQTSLAHVQQEIAQKQAAGVAVPASQLSYEQSLESSIRSLNTGPAAK